jgi:hypothetical protein
MFREDFREWMGVKKRDLEVCQDAIWIHQCSRALYPLDKRDFKAIEGDITVTSWINNGLVLVKTKEELLYIREHILSPNLESLG